MSPRYVKIWSLVVATLFILALSPVGASAPSLENLAGGLKINKKEISVSGISSGGFMAHQFHVDHSEHIMGVGIVAGGPYYCAQNSILDAVNKCSRFVGLECAALSKLFGLDPSVCKKIERSPTDENAVKQLARESFDEAKKQNTLKNIKEAKIYLFSGIYDEIVPQTVMDAVYDFYTDPNKAGVEETNVYYNRDFPARHTMVRDSFDKPAGKNIVGDCALPPKPSIPPAENSFIDDCQQVAEERKMKNSCICPPTASAEPQTATACPPSDKKEICDDADDVDLAGAILQQIYGEEALKAGRTAVQENEVQAFNQRQIFGALSPTPFTALQLASMAKDGYVFIPEACKQGSECKLHVAFHGCLQGGQTDARTGHSGNLFSKYAGYNEWAKANNIVVLYPQVRRWNGSLANPPINPQGCWDWWGQDYTHENYHTKHGIQIKAVARMINVLAGDENLLEIPAN